MELNKGFIIPPFIGLQKGAKKMSASVFSKFLELGVMVLMDEWSLIELNNNHSKK